MAKVTLGPIVSGITGSVGSAIFKKNGNHTSVYSISNRSCKTSKITPVYQELLSKASKDWSLMQASVRRYYNQIAPIIPRYSPLYGSIPLTGREYFIKFQITAKLCGQTAYYLFSDPNAPALGRMEANNIHFGTDLAGTTLQPPDIWIPTPWETTYWGISLWMGWGKKFTHWHVDDEIPSPGPLPRTWFQVWPQPLTQQTFPFSGMDNAILSATGGFPGIDYSSQTSQPITRHIWVKWRGFAGWTIYESGNICLTANSTWSDNAPTFYPASPLYPPSGTYEPTMRPW